MSCHQKSQQEDLILHKAPEGVWLELADPCFLRSDTVLYTPRDHSLHAVMHESLHLMGHIEAADDHHLQAQPHIRLTAKHPNGTALALQKRLVIAIA
ncbi:MAG: hypothetical protein L6Q57_08730 [Alphaproteobacteria bacterium]|nr:hypothetical protein [Alphaproteobacteria bacterium]